MKIAVNLARNISLSVDGEEFGACIEVALTTKEPQYLDDADGHRAKEFMVQTIRFGTDPDGLRGIAKGFLEWADEADEIATKAAAGKLKLYGTALTDGKD